MQQLKDWGRSNFSIMMSNWLVAPDLIDRPKEKGATLKRNNEGKYMYKEFNTRSSVH